MIICDTGPLVAAALTRDSEHERCVRMFTELHQANRELLVPSPMVAEVCYHLAKVSARTEAGFLTSLADGTLTPVDLVVSDYLRMAELVVEYADLRLGASDAAVVAVAERLGVTEVATIDYRGFRTVRPNHTTHFTLLPD